MGVRLCSGEADASDFYDTFSVNSMPFPGVSAYKDFKENWDQNIILTQKSHTSEDQAVLMLSEDFKLPNEDDWETYKNWEVLRLLQNYLLYIFFILRGDEPDQGILIHCISGWDRTPMFIGILRILLWAEGLIHQSLDADQLLYLVVGYDWLLFGHQLLSRLKKGAQIFYFSFWVLTGLLEEDYSLTLGKNEEHLKKPTPETKLKRQNSSKLQPKSPPKVPRANKINSPKDQNNNLGKKIAGTKSKKDKVPKFKSKTLSPRESEKSPKIKKKPLKIAKSYPEKLDHFSTKNPENKTSPIPTKTSKNEKIKLDDYMEMERDMTLEEIEEELISDKTIFQEKNDNLESIELKKSAPEKKKKTDLESPKSVRIKLPENVMNSPGLSRKEIKKPLEPPPPENEELRNLRRARRYRIIEIWEKFNSHYDEIILPLHQSLQQNK